MTETRPPKRLPPLDWLRVFEAAGRHGNFTAAAEELGASQGAVSQRIRNLESWLGRKLFLRAARGVQLTVDGESYLPLVQETLRALEQGTDNLFGQGGRELRIAALPSHLELLVLPRLRRFAKNFPGLRLVLDTVPKRGEFDAAETAVHIRYGRGPWPGRDAALIAGEVLQPMLAPGLDGSWRGMPAISLRGERPGWSEWARLTGEAAPGTGWLSADSMSYALQAARLGQGVVLGSRVLARGFLAEGSLRPVPAPELAITDGYWLTWPPGLGRSARQKAVLDTLLDALAG